MEGIVDLKSLKELDGIHCIQNYGRYDVAFESGKGSILFDTSGKEYIDFSSGIGVTSIGHCHPHFVEEVKKQIDKLCHVSNLYYTKPYAVLAKQLTLPAKMKRAFFCNSGAEANEAAIKLARKYSKDKYGDGRSTIITLNKSFHGRTMATITATGQADFHKDFTPFLEGFKYVDANDIEAMKKAISNDVCAVMVEGIQGEGGVIPLNQEYLKELSLLTAENDILLIFDEVQTGIGRTGQFFSYLWYDIKPDLVTVAKGLGGGLPIGALLTNEKCGSVLTKGSHGSTFGGNLIACAAAKAVLDVVLEDGFLDGVKRKGEFLKSRIKEFETQVIRGVRGKGLMLGIEIDGKDVKEISKELLEMGVITLTAGGNILRLLPPLTISDDEMKRGLDMMHRYFASL
jgi:acetylornithine/N-succinyldiaminopimelate aminotransferase